MDAMEEGELTVLPRGLMTDKNATTMNHSTATSDLRLADEQPTDSILLTTPAMPRPSLESFDPSNHETIAKTIADATPAHNDVEHEKIVIGLMPERKKRYPKQHDNTPE